ncbi:MAG: DUF401 family protein [Nitrososphaerota archaeon]|nr:DUF401 family protein [Candidatus Bathyarchaeota archaeon]MDW8023558.1 DUF401 family protein [Nitrososphaerota archaeon]
MGLVNPLIAVVISFFALGIMLYKRVNLGIVLTLTAVILALLSVDWFKIPNIVYTSVNPATIEGQLTISVVIATFGIMWLSQLYRETGFIRDLSGSLSRIIRNSKIILSVLPAVVGLLPVAGGALMSAPIVDSEAEKLKMNLEKKAYTNVWFRHIILPIYPLSPVLIITAAMVGTTTSHVIMRQIPVVAVMIIAGYILSFWKAPILKNMGEKMPENTLNSDLKVFLKAFTPILVTIVVAISLGLIGFDLSKRGLDVLIAAFAGLLALALLSKTSFKVFLSPLRSRAPYGIALATYGAFLLRNVMNASGLSEAFKPLVAGGGMNDTILLVAIPTVLGFLTGSPQGGVIISLSILSEILSLSLKTAALIYVTAHLGYLIAPTHLCLTFTADYFKSSIGKVYKYLIPSFMAAFAAALLVYFLPI